MRWNDRVYGEAAITDPAILALIDPPPSSGCEVSARPGRRPSPSRSRT